ncbi:MAG TPA: hypothetical protein VFN49_09870 [Candidatus Aquilonibacter sp.]|nr:hypothetical protein [Candidatus Aquilonibacter sp.]
MMGSRPVREPAEFVIWSATALLGIMVGIGTAFMLWSAFHSSAEQSLVAAAIVAIALGLSLVALAIDNIPSRLFVWVAAATLVIAFFTGPTFFAALLAAS